MSIDRIAAVAARAGRGSDTIRLLAVTTGRTSDDVVAARRAGVVDFAATSVDELAFHAAALGAGVSWHFVGRLHPDAARRARNTVGLLHTLDTPGLLDAWIKGPGAAPPVLVQVAPTPDADGVQPDRVAGLVAHARRAGVEVRGLSMADSRAPDVATARRWFGELRRLRDRLEDGSGELPELAMGTPDDYEVAVEEGSTLIRLGTTIFGSRR